MAETLVEVSRLKKYFPIKKGVMRRAAGFVRAVDDVSFAIPKGKVMGLVGESGCGKSTAGRTILRLLCPTEGSVRFAGREISSLPKREMNRLRTRMQIIFQDPYSSLNPRLPVAEIVGEAMLQHGIVKSKREMRDRVIEVIGKCGLFPEQAWRYPHQFSGGQRQRVCIARALAVNPEFIVCDEAVSALDVSIQSQIINLLKDMQQEMNLTYLFISHDLSVVKFISDEVGVMYLGQMVEIGPKERLFANPLHPYTEALLAAAPTFDPEANRARKRVLLEGDIPSPANPPSGCRFNTRCVYCQDECRVVDPEPVEAEAGHFVKCHRLRKGA
ncbi:MAG: ABC transporter ATP-binding protein [Oscillospiraceae bacterium]|jgi:oligopeptide/dipeptide ABC transporter ATP-binding protein|nr:ABC transporter ATP-binding protein [Oscillospiraceae bacterium]